MTSMKPPAWLPVLFSYPRGGSNKPVWTTCGLRNCGNGCRTTKSNGQTLLILVVLLRTRLPQQTLWILDQDGETHKQNTTSCGPLLNATDLHREGGPVAQHDRSGRSTSVLSAENPVMARYGNVTHSESLHATRRKKTIPCPAAAVVNVSPLARSLLLDVLDSFVLSGLPSSLPRFEDC